MFKRRKHFNVLCNLAFASALALIASNPSFADDIIVGEKDCTEKTNMKVKFQIFPFTQVRTKMATPSENARCNITPISEGKRDVNIPLFRCSNTDIREFVGKWADTIKGSTYRYDIKVKATYFSNKELSIRITAGRDILKPFPGDRKALETRFRYPMSLPGNASEIELEFGSFTAIEGLLNDKPECSTKVSLYVSKDILSTWMKNTRSPQ